MELISQRVARGLEVRPRKRRHSPFFSDPDIAQSLSLSHSDHGSSNWEKVGKHAAGAREYVGNVKETFKGDNVRHPLLLEEVLYSMIFRSGKT
jgi:GRAM domain-containing protein 4